MTTPLVMPTSFIARTHPIIGSMFVTRNAYPREALVETLLDLWKRICRHRPSEACPNLRLLAGAAFRKVRH